MLGFFLSLLKIGISGSAEGSNPGYSELVLRGGFPGGHELRQWPYFLKHNSPGQEVLLPLFANEKIETHSN